MEFLDPQHFLTVAQISKYLLIFRFLLFHLRSFIDMYLSQPLLHRLSLPVSLLFFSPFSLPSLVFPCCLLSRIENWKKYLSFFATVSHIHAHTLRPPTVTLSEKNSQRHKMRKVTRFHSLLLIRKSEGSLQG